MEIVLGVVVMLVLVVVVAARRLNRSRPGAAAPSYKPRTPFMSKAELSFFGVLRQAVADRAYIAAKVRVADVIQPSVSQGKDRSAWQRAFNAIQAKHFDFVLCSPEGGQCKVAIELDDKSHKSKKRRERDALLDEAMESAGLPLVRIPAKAGYSVGQLRETLAPLLAGVATSEESSAPPSAKDVAISAEESDACPTCGASRVLCAGDSVGLTGKSFWKCSRYPTCRYVGPAVG